MRPGVFRPVTRCFMRTSYRRACDRCGRDSGTSRWKGQPLFCAECKAARKRERMESKAWTGACRRCAKPLRLLGRQASEARIQGQAYCSQECREAQHRERSSRTMARTNRRYASERMRERNPMRRPEARERMGESLRRLGHEPKIRGGNGRPLSKPQAMLAEALGPEWHTEWVVPTKMGKGSGYPPHYKIDIAHPKLLVAVEVDGPSHSAIARQEQDARKDALLGSRGWTVLRFSNRDVIERLEECARTVAYTTWKLRARTPTSRTAS